MTYRREPGLGEISKLRSASPLAFNSVKALFPPGFHDVLLLICHLGAAFVCELGLTLDLPLKPIDYGTQASAEELGGLFIWCDIRERQAKLTMGGAVNRVCKKGSPGEQWGG